MGNLLPHRVPDQSKCFILIGSESDVLQEFTALAEATDSTNAVIEGFVYVSVPHDQRENAVIVDDGQLYNSYTID